MLLVFNRFVGEIRHINFDLELRLQIDRPRSDERPRLRLLPLPTMEASYGTTTTLILLDLPLGASITYDTHAFTSTTSFRGIKRIPEGVHLLTYGLDQSALGMRTGFFFLAKPGDVSAWKWNKKTEQLERLDEHLEPKELQARLQSLHPYLTSTPTTQGEEIQTAWSDLTCYINPSLLSRIIPTNWTFASHTPSANDDTTQQLSNLPTSKTEEILHFTSIDLKRTFNPAALGRERTSQFLDKTYYLETLLQQLPDELALLGELQLSFVAMLYMNNFSGFEAWKNIFTVFCGCKGALMTHAMLFRHFLRVLREQFEMCSQETFEEVILESQFVSTNLKALNSAIEELDPKSSALEFAFAQLTALVGAKFNWDPISGGRAQGGQGGTGAGVVAMGYDETGWDQGREEGDYAPVVVEVDEMPSDDEGMDVDVDFKGRWESATGKMDMSTGKMVFGRH
jgi:A1 cistron-splicing factor AAR2